MSVTLLKSTSKKANSKEILYNDCRNVVEENFRRELRMNLGNGGIREYETFESIFLNSLHKNSNCTKKIIRVNQKPYMTRTLRENITKISEFERSLDISSLDIQFFTLQMLQTIKGFGQL